MFQKVLIANRGEIAVRIIRACRELGIATVAIYTEQDSESVHVSKADEAILVEPGPRAGYLDAEQIAAVARKAGADAVHPGYGFLSEKSHLPKALAAAGVGFIGPGVRAIETMGDKVEARKIALAAGVPLIPASPILENLGEVRNWAEKIGFPVMLKAAAGGGGKGMRMVRAAGELANAYALSGSEAEKAFGDGRLYMEKFVEEPKHIEIQVICDKHGNRVHLYERDCSIQRRHQKLIEIAPSLVLDDAKREEMGRVALRLCEAVGYDSAGTLEFLLDKEGNYYFLEMNTRIQVEHTITELVTGIDIVQEMIRVASGEPLSFTQADVTLRGHAIECRINAEDPRRNFIPSPGRITRYLSPGGIGIRLDSCIYAGYEVQPYFDPLISKLCVWGRTWEEALRRMSRALNEYVIRGIQTTVPGYQKIILDPDFREGKFTTYFMEEKIDAFQYPDPEEHLDPFFLAGAALFAHYLSGRLAETPRSFTVKRHGESFDVLLEGKGPWEERKRSLFLRIGGEAAKVEITVPEANAPPAYEILHHGRRHEVEFVEILHPEQKCMPIILREDGHMEEVLFFLPHDG